MNAKETLKAAMFGLAITVGAVSLTAPPPASAQFAVFDPINYVQSFLTQLRAVQSNLNEVRQIQQQLEQLRYMQENTKGLTQGDWNVSSNSIDRLVGILESGQALAVSGKQFESRFKSMFPEYRPDQNYAQAYDRWNATTRDSVLGAMRVANLQVQGIDDETAALSRLRAAAQSTDGQKAALDAANQISLATIDQLQQLRELMVAQTQIAGAQAAAAAQAEQTRRNTAEEMMDFDGGDSGSNGSAFCAVPPCR